MKRFLKEKINIWELFFPPKCVCCREPLATPTVYERTVGDDALCKNCRDKFEMKKNASCPRCKRSFFECTCMPQILRDENCRTLMRVCGYSGKYFDPVTRIVFTLKQKAMSSCERFSAYQLSRRLMRYLAEHPDEEFCVTYIPRRKRAVMLFGHEHGEIMAKRLAELCDLPFLGLLQNSKGNKEQKKLDPKARYENARKSISASKYIYKVRGKNVILVDDIVTTGASLCAATSVLTGFGAASVSCICLASAEKEEREN